MKVLIILLLAVACNRKKSELVFHVPAEPSVVSSGNLSFEQIKKEVLIPKCISCHGNSGGINLESYSSTIRHLREIERSVLQTKSMPRAPMTPLDERQLEILTKWLDAGAPETVLGFNDIKKKVLDKKCISCHKAGEHAGHIPFEREEEIKSFIVKGNPDASLFYTITAPGAMNMMPPIGVDPLTKEEREMLREWILTN